MRMLLAVLAAGLSCGCGDGSIKRTGYETLQNIRQQECYKTPSVGCEDREKLEVYEERRQEVKLVD